MAKIHFKDSDDPLKEGEDVEALCGEVISKAAFAYMEDIEAVARPAEMAVFRSACRDCLKVPMEKRRRYAIIHGELSIHPEDL